jgi:hypothetical protein
MSEHLEWSGLPLTRSIELTLDVPFATDAPAYWRLPHNDAGERTVRVELAEGQVWPRDMRRGRAVAFEMEGLGSRYRFEGRVQYRRLGRLVGIGRVTTLR